MYDHVPFWPPPALRAGRPNLPFTSLFLFTFPDIAVALHARDVVKIDVRLTLVICFVYVLCSPDLQVKMETGPAKDYIFIAVVSRSKA